MAIVRSVGAALCVATAVLSPAPAGAVIPCPIPSSPRVDPPSTQVSPVTLAEVSGGEAEGSSRLVNLGALLRHDVEIELAAIDWKKAGLRRRYLLSAAVVRLDSKHTGDRALAASCTVSASVRDAERGNVLAIVEGKARAEDAPSAAAEAERDALAGAVRTAIGALPEAIRRAQ